MIDFRYHIVSLISVFLALAVGIALGAGPLKETIGDSLTGQVEALRVEKDELRAQLDDSDAALGRSQAWIDSAGERLLAGQLADRRVAVIVLGEVPDELRNAVTGRLTQAGASVSAQVTLTGAWTDPGMRSFRQALVGNMVQYLEPGVAADAAADTALAAALAQAITGSDAADPDARSESASILLELLSSGETPLVTLAEEVTAPADAVVVLAVPAPSADAGAEPTTATDEEISARLAVAAAAQQYSTGAVLVDSAHGPGSVIDALLADGELAAQVSTVSGAQEVTGQVVVPLALAAAIGGQVGHYGAGDGETLLPPEVTLPPVDRTPRLPEAAPEAPTPDAGQG